VKVDVKIVRKGGRSSCRHLTELLWSIVAVLPGSYACFYVSCVHLQDAWNTLLITYSLDLTYS